jgi:hypothetical protein
MSFMDQPDPIRSLALATRPRPPEKRAAGWQIALTAIGAIAIVTIFLWGINNQRDEAAGQQTATTEAAPPVQEAKPQGEQQQQPGQQQQVPNQAPATTGQGGGNQQNGRPSPNADQKRSQSPTNSGQNGSPAAKNGQPAQPGATQK